MPSAADSDRSLLIEGLGKGLRVIESFSHEHPQLTATEAGRRAGLTRTAARRYLVSLVHFGYADTDGKHYWLRPSVLRLGQAYLEAARLPRLAQTFLQRLSAQTGETVNLGVVDGHQVVYLARSDSPRGVSIGFTPGARVAAHLVSPGYAVASTWTQERLDEWIDAHDFSGWAVQTAVDAARFSAEVAQAREKGHAWVDQYIDAGLCGLAVPLSDRKGRCIGALSTTVQSQLWSQAAALARLLPALQEAAGAIRAVV